MNQQTTICDITYQELLKDIFLKKKNAQNVVTHWLAFNKTKRNVNYKINSIYNGDEPVKKIKDTAFKIIDEIQNTNIIYQLFLDILVFKPSLEIIGTNIHLFRNVLYGIPVTELSLNGIEYFKFFYKNAKYLFHTRNYGFGQNILQDSVLSVPTISFKIRTGILFILHQNIIQHVKDFLTSSLRKQKFTNKQNRIYYIEYIREYSKQVNQVFLVILKNQKPLYVYQNEKSEMLRFLTEFVNYLNDVVFKLSLKNRIPTF